MPIKTKELKFGELNIKIKELSFAGQNRLNLLKDKLTIEDLYKECIIKHELLEELTKEEGLVLVKEINEINGWNKDKETDFQEPTSTSGK